MSTELKQNVSKDATFDLLDIRVGRILNAEIEPTAPKKAYRLKVDFGKFGIRTSVGRFSQHSVEEITGKLVLGVLNMGSIKIGDVESEVLILGTQYPKADSGEATFITPASDSKIGGKLF